jgi:hypothetical protein
VLRAQDDAQSRREAIEAIYPVMIAALEAKNFGRARNICDQAIIWEPQNPVHHYNLACIEAQAGGARLPYAMGALELAVALGFNDELHLKNDPDLVPLHSNPRFADLVRKVAHNASADAALAAIEIPDTSTKHAPSPTTNVTDEPAKPAFNQGVPVGLYFMTRYWPGTHTLEKAAWYFAPDGTVYQNIEDGFSRDSLAAHVGPKGNATSKGRQLEVTWSDGKKSTSDVERDGAGFAWDMGIFTPVTAYENTSDIVGVYEGGESIGTGGTSAAVSQRLELRADGTFTWSGVSFVGADAKARHVNANRSNESRGRWQLSGYALILTDTSGAVWRRIAFPCDDEKTPNKPERMFFGGILYKRL